MSDQAAPLSSLTCRFCLNTEIKQCAKCQRHFCAEHASRYIPTCCQDCFVNVTVLIDTYVKQTEDYDEKTDTTTIRKDKAKRIRLDGPDYVWYMRALQDISDEQMGAVLEFHRHMVSLLEHVETVRKVKKSQELSKLPTPKITVSTTTEVKKKRVVKQQKDLKQMLIGMGIKGAALDGMLKAAGYVETPKEETNEVKSEISTNS